MFIQDSSNIIGSASKISEKRSVVSAISISVLPILSPYAFIGPIPLSALLLGISTFLIFIFGGTIKKSISLPLTLLWITHLMLSLIAYFFTPNGMSLVNSLILISFNIFCFIVLVSNTIKEDFWKYSNYFGILSCAFLYIQALFLAIGKNPPVGKIEFLNLLDHASFISTTWGFRLNSVFQEPSYFAIYLLPLLVINLSDKKYLISIFYVFGLWISSSSMGILGSLIVLVYFSLINKSYMKKMVLILTGGVLLHLFFYNFIEYYSVSINRSIDKISYISEDSSIRISGQSFLFDLLPFHNQLFGVGINQMQNYFLGSIHNVYNYSNSFIITLINTGVLGFISYLIFILYLAYKSLLNKRLIFMLLFLIVAATDYFIYNYFFFYLLTFIIIQSERPVKKNENIVRNIEVSRN